MWSYDLEKPKLRGKRKKLLKHSSSCAIIIETICERNQARIPDF